MNDKNTNPSSPRQSFTTQHQLISSDKVINYTATAAWQLLYKEDQAIAEMFSVAYLAETDSPNYRPITFVFNGGPGASSAYLHMGAIGPTRVAFDTDGNLPKPPVKLVDNQESWLEFSDLVFIDPIGTGFSRALPEDKEKPEKPKEAGKEEKKPAAQFWEVKEDLNAIGQFIQRFLSKNHRWLSPVFIAGESYGGFRVAKLARLLPESFGIGISGAILISPALEFSLLEGTDYNLSYWASLVPCYAGVAAHYSLAKWVGEAGDIDSRIKQAEIFSRETLIPFLAKGDTNTPETAAKVYQSLSDLIGLPVEVISKHGGRIDREVFARKLLESEGKILGLYDASITAFDPFPDRSNYEAGDPTLSGYERLFTAGINHHLRVELQIDTDLSYHLLNFDVFKQWQFQLENEFKQGYLGAVDDLRVGMNLNPYMRVRIDHGIFDLVTTYFASQHLVGLMKLVPEIRKNLTLNNYKGGHMFYTWDSSRQEWFNQIKDFYQTE